MVKKLKRYSEIFLSYHNGNGLTIYDRRHEELIVAHISPNREVTFYEKRKKLTKKEKDFIENIAKKDDRNISITQKEKVFNTRPKNA